MNVTRKLSEAIAAYVFLAPLLVVLLAFVGWPLLDALWLSFHSYDLFSSPRFTGLANYRHLFRQADFWLSLRNTVVYTVGVVAAQTWIALLLALMMDQRLRGKTFFRVAFFLPSVTSSVAISLVFMLLFFKNGLLNQLLEGAQVNRFLAGIGVSTPVDWLGDPHTALSAIMAMNVWSTAGFFMIVFLAGLQDIPETLYEVARLDGAGALARFRYITLPLLRPTLFFVLTMGLIGSFQVFDQVFIMTNGGPLKATMTLAYMLYREAFVNFDMGYACAIAMILAALIFGCTMAQKRLLGE